MKRGAPGVLRIIGGRWRSRLIAFDPGTGLRATPDRVRQTVFDWLAPTIAGARCLDLYAGSGAMGFEALSRGALSVSFVERNAAEVERLRQSAASLAAGAAARILHADARTVLDARIGSALGEERFDVVFLDPPYVDDAVGDALEALRPWLSAHHRVYVEWPHGRPQALPEGYRWVRRKAAGRVSYGLVSCDAGTGDGQ
ncbi:MAG TPA: 16S rRNA (guanine(966)-N(2))-methyltransferase RsmD [Nevskiaceae bacterium]